MKANIYIIRNAVNDYVYIGSTTRSINQRFREHKSRANTGSKNYHLYQFMREVGINHFYIELYAEVETDDILNTEYQFICDYPYRDKLLNTFLGHPIQTVEKVIELYKNKVTMKEIGKSVGMCKSTVSNILKKRGIEIRDWNKEQSISEITKEKLQELYVDQYLTTKEIAKIYNLSDTAIRNWLIKYNIPRRKAVNRKYLCCTKQ